MSVYQRKFPIHLMAPLLGVSVSGFYLWRSRRFARPSRRDEDVVKAITSSFLSSYRTYGSPRVHADLRRHGISVGKNRVADLMRRHGMKAKMKRQPFLKRRFAKEKRAFAHDLVQRKFIPPEPNKIWASDITFIWSREGWLYLAVVMDLFSRKVIGFEMSHRPGKELALNALANAIASRKTTSDLIHHSDQGIHYTCHDYVNRLKSLGIKPSFGGRGECWDNAVVESFFHSLKTELIYFERFATRLEARKRVSEWIQGFYNRRRLHSTLGFLSPTEYERALQVS